MGGNEPGSEPAEIAHEPLELSFLEPEEEPTKEEVVDESEDKNDEGVEPGQGD
ncbi:hypothetical protein MTX80_03640 [Gordonia amicalis]|nr:hypothetical protein [Gordonia amicalis]UOG22184.1 hypothetical protein MTX80_03640 [Gordonia amicalis]